MALEEKLPPPSELKRLLADGNTAADLAERFGVAVQSIYNKSSTARIERELAVRDINQFMPWPLARPDHQRSDTAVHLRLVHSLRANDNVMPATVRRRAEAWAQDLEYNDFVISYHPDTPSSRFESKGGFFIRPRRAGDSPGLMQLPSSSEQPPTQEMLDQWYESWRKKHLE